MRPFIQSLVKRSVTSAISATRIPPFYAAQRYMGTLNYQLELDGLVDSFADSNRVLWDGLADIL